MEAKNGLKNCSKENVFLSKGLQAAENSSIIFLTYMDDAEILHGLKKLDAEILHDLNFRLIHYFSYNNCMIVDVKSLFKYISLFSYSPPMKNLQKSQIFPLKSNRTPNLTLNFNRSKKLKKMRFNGTSPQ